jgi:hypothetical protein
MANYLSRLCVYEWDNAEETAGGGAQQSFDGHWLIRVSTNKQTPKQEKRLVSVAAPALLLGRGSPLLRVDG